MKNWRKSQENSQPNDGELFDNLGVIVLTKDSEKTIRQCLESIVMQIPYNELIIVDGNSTDKTLDIVKRFPRVKIIEKVIGRGNGRAVALENADWEILVWIDSDITLDKEWWKHARMKFDRDTDMVFGKVENADKRNFWSRVLDVIYQFALWHRLPTFETNNMIIRKESLLKVGEWDRRLIASEDMDLRIRMQRANMRIIFVRDAIAFHFHRVSFKGILKQFSEWGSVYHHFRMKYGERFPWLRTLAFPITSARVAAWGILYKHEPEGLLAGITYLFARLAWLRSYKKGILGAAS